MQQPRGYHVASTAEQSHGVRTQWPESVSGARGVAAPVPRTRQCRHEWTEKKKEPRNGLQKPRKKRACQLPADREQSAFSRRDRKQPSVVQDPKTQCTQQDREDARCDGTPSSHSSQQRTGADSPDSALSLKAQQSQFIDEATVTAVSAQRQPGFRRSWRFLSCSTLMRRSISLLIAQKTAWTPQDQSNEKRVDDTVIMQTSSSSPSSTVNSEDASDSGSDNATEW